MTKRNRRSGARRGATMVLVAVMILVVAGMAAFAIDLARVYTGVNEMQTGADATALAAAHRFQRTGTSPVNGALAFAAQNSAFGTPLTLNAGDVEPIVWNPATRAIAVAGSWAVANGVRVTMRRTATLPFGGVIGRAAISPTRSGVVWLANQTARDCMQPWGLSTAYVSSLLGGRAITGQPGVGFLSTEVSTLAGQRRQTVVARPPGTATGTNVAPTIFEAMIGTGTDTSTYGRELRGEECDGVTSHAAERQENVIQVAVGGDVARKTIDGVENALRPICRTQGANGSSLDDATCYDPGTGQAGVTVLVAAASPGSGIMTVDGFAAFKLMCVFRGAGIGGSRATEFCPFLTGNLPDNDYMQGTLVGYAMPGVALIGGGNEIGRALSTAQKLLLVR